MKDTAHARITRRILKARSSLRAWGVRRRAGASALFAFALFVVGAGVAFGCGWMGTSHSVRFNAWLDEDEFSRLPPLPFSAREKTKGAGEYDEDDYEEWERARARREQLGKEVDALWARAEEASKSGDLALARELLGRYLARSDEEDCGQYYERSVSGCAQARVNSANDQLEALAALERGAGRQAVLSYLSARQAYDAWMLGEKSRKRDDSSTGGDAGGEGGDAEGEGDACEADGGGGEPSSTASEAGPSPGDEVRRLLEGVPPHASLDGHVAYLRAAVLYREEKLAEAAEAFALLASRGPRGGKREAALYMAGLLNLKQSKSYTGEYADAGEACAECRDDAWRAAFDSFTRLLAEYPRGRFSADARGWLGYLRLRVGETAEGLAEYYRLLADARDESARAEGYSSLKLTRHAASESDMERLETLLAAEPRVALTYAYHEIYNYALPAGAYIDIPAESNPYRYEKDSGGYGYSDNYYEWEEKERKRLRAEQEKKSLSRVAAFATRMMRSRAGAEVGGGFALRLAQAQLELGDSKAAHELARRALSAGVGGDERAGAMWVKGVAEQRLRDYASSRRTLEALVEEFPSGDLTEGARRLLAITAEDSGDLDAALEQYLALGYSSDVAYFVDVLMTPAQLEAFASRRPDIPQRDTLYYSLGVRYLRLGRFEEARAAYGRVRPDALGIRPPWYEESGCAGDRPDNLRPCSDPKEPDGEEPNVVPARWVMRDLKTMDEIERLEDRAGLASGDEEKAEALYQLASYYYEASELAFYNPAAWRGLRGVSFLYDQELRAPGEAQLMRRYMEEHEPLVRALKTYLEVVRLYPRTRAARDSLYTSAVIHYRLVGYQWYWPGQYSQGLHPGERLVTYEDVRREYPHYQLPRGTYGWEPATRTVNGGPGWAEAPKPKPLSGTERARRKVKRAEVLAVKGWSLFGEVAGGRLRRWSLALLSLAGFLAFWRATRRSRALLLRLLARFARRTPRTPDVMPRPTSSFAAHEPYTFGARAGAATRGAFEVLRQIALDRRGRAALALNLLTHGVLTALLWTLAWALRSG
jgi:TolA-binding protein